MNFLKWVIISIKFLAVKQINFLVWVIKNIFEITHQNCVGLEPIVKRLNVLNKVIGYTFLLLKRKLQDFTHFLAFNFKYCWVFYRHEQKLVSEVRTRNKWMNLPINAKVTFFYEFKLLIKCENPYVIGVSYN